ncbi:vWA domain-containing protein [Teredinibacter sp. KSP-S5-2]|uniref:vWA domain-containing protein n=1 Tax=Teredinibacter sp. KSP-S5-2 TaxID=3034506 RepID=UPI0029349508|nr:vWA domain-containing protein [Teredinibacter sp. KSP-S5-2]WNO11714.1 VWA domain-containing protein [Teredinibacter sp. KSP-S5-2]
MHQIRFSCLLLVCFFLPLSGHTQDQSRLPPDVRLIIDVSGSMKQNDPNNLRQPAVELLVQLLPEDSKAGVWTFGQWVNMLVPHKPVESSWKDDALSSAKKINSVGLYTNIGDALEKAAYDRSAPNDKYRTSLILLTDGMVDIDKDPEKNKEEWRRIVDDVIPKLKEAGYVIHTIALSDNADTNLLNKLSLGTDGLAEVAHTADDLMRIFLKAFDVAAPAEQVPLTDNQFVIDSSVEEFTALIFRQSPDEQTRLVGPDNEEYSANIASRDVSWHRADNYDLITVKRPLEGEWGVIAAMDPESRITVVSNLNLRVKPLPNNVFKGQEETLKLLLKEDGQTITREEFLSLMDITAAMEAGKDEFELKEYWQSSLSETVPGDGIFQAALPVFDKDGIYQLNVTVDGKSFKRHFSHQFTVREPFGANVEQALIDGKSVYVLTANAFSQDIDVASTQIVATVKAPGGRKKIYPLTATEVDTWQAHLHPDLEGQYVAEIRVKGNDDRGNDFDIQLDDITFNYTVDEGFSKTAEPFFAEPEPAVEEKEPESPIEEKVEEPKESPPAEQEPEPEVSGSVFPPWLIYILLGLGNLTLFALGFFAFKKIMSSGNKDLLDEFSDEKVNEEEPEIEEEPEEELDEEEPPMEDLDPIIEEPSMEMGMEMEMEPEPAFEEEPQIESEPADDIPPEPELEIEPPVVEDVADDGDFDDLDEMVPEDVDDDVDDDVATEEEDEEDDMVAAMLKAQGLDLAEEELDDAISGLIDELDEQEAAAQAAADAENDFSDTDFDDMDDFDEDDKK